MFTKDGSASAGFQPKNGLHFAHPNISPVLPRCLPFASLWSHRHSGFVLCLLSSIVCIGSLSINRFLCESSWAQGIFSCTWVVLSAHPRFCYKGHRSTLFSPLLLSFSFSFSSVYSVYSTRLHPLHIYNDFLPFLCRRCLC